ncbi:unnamed protein product [Rotaria sordida]|uniref:Uncharacterized protein n=2 Tax=Rotaria sordida TaxID=392033 RepID=A0A814JK29_9BILA|nr:unnamed protein product [Rotaria sordida]CAF1039102.1 unnamed protein product [Rotaria sordida]
MPQQNEHLSFTSDEFVFDMDYSEARNILDLTTTKQKQLRRQRSQTLYTQLLLKRTYVHVCELLNSDCLIEKPTPLSIVDTNKRKLSSDHHDVSSKSKKCKNSIDNDILQFLRELNSVKVTNSEYIELSSCCSSIGQTMSIAVVVRKQSTDTSRW